jgi:hypothetical protein
METIGNLRGGEPMRWPRTTRLLVSLLLVLLANFVVAPLASDRTSASVSAANECLAGMQYVPDQLVVAFKPGQSLVELQDRNRIAMIIITLYRAGVVGLAAPPIRLPTGTIVLFEFRSGTDLCSSMSMIRALPEVQFVGPNLIGGPPPGEF